MLISFFNIYLYHKNGAIPYERNLHNSFRDAVDIRGREQEFIDNYVAALKSEGYDSIIIRNTVADASKNYGNKTTQNCVFDPEQIKSVDNSGEFSPASSNIYESIEYAVIFNPEDLSGLKKFYG